MAVLMILLTIHLWISLETLLARKNIEGTVLFLFFFWQIGYADVVRWLMISAFLIFRVPLLQWNLSVTTTSEIKFITCDLFSNVF